ncbi:hypothetical protein OV760_30000, partial [Salmonella enterica subsp. enterica serovar 1,4,[5],12:i:-]|nr:hypothetical protein [Salmonella enterica subsp. enterica serovar 1,4,[5],12:i:-]
MSAGHQDGQLHDPELDYKFNFDYEDSSLAVNFKPITIADAKPEHNMMFYIRLCPRGVIKNLDNHCIPFNNPEER